MSLEEAPRRATSEVDRRRPRPLNAISMSSNWSKIECVASNKLRNVGYTYGIP